MAKTIPYRPSNGTEGDSFICHFCCNCERDIDEDCPILAATFIYDEDDPDYPKEWVQDVEPELDPEDGLPVGAGNARCTAFVPRGESLPSQDDRTLDMFPALSELEAGT
jgi:hypothetical protein